MLFVQGDNVKETDSEDGLQALAFLKERNASLSRMGADVEVTVDIKPTVPVYELLTDACSYLSRFLLDHMRGKGELGFLAETVEPIKLDSLRQFLDTYSERLRIFVDEEGRKRASTIASFQALNIIESYSSWLKTTEPQNEVDASHRDGFLRSLIQLRAELFEVAYTYESKVVKSKIEQELSHFEVPQDPLLLRESHRFPAGSLIARTRNRGEQLRAQGELLRIEQELCGVLTAMEVLLDDLKNSTAPQFGFVIDSAEQEVQSHDLVLSLFQASKGLGRMFLDLQQGTGVDLALRLHIQNTLTLTDALLSHVLQSGYENEIASSGISEMTRYIGSARYALEEILEQVRVYSEDTSQA